MTGAHPGAGIVHQEPVMGTVVTFNVAALAPAAEVEAALRRAVEWLHWVDETFSTYKPESEVCRFDRGELEIGACGRELRHVLALCHRFNEETGGYFDAWAGGSFDPSGVVKGWSIQEASRLLSEAGVANHLVDGGGDVVVRGQPRPGVPWHVGVRHPLRPEAYCAAVAPGDGAVATSGTYERGRHVLNPFTGKPATGLVSVTLVGPELTVADAYATAALAMGAKAPAWLDGLSGYEALVVGADGRGWSSRGWAALAAEGLSANTPA
ncbi:MAG TPA: FAD:protein FMN transferase [Acidimicrobiales bacterium]|nr:FAD:protein FMN transferase [Acidimicrobiales bacterium]